MQIKKKTKSTIVSWLFGTASVELLCQFEPRELVTAGILGRVEAHLLWRLNQMIENTPGNPSRIQEIRTLLQRRCLFNAAINLRDFAGSTPGTLLPVCP